MLKNLRVRIQQGYRTMAYPGGALPELPERFTGRPRLAAGHCPEDCRACVSVCPTEAVSVETGEPVVDMGRCLFCRACEKSCEQGSITFSGDHMLAATSRKSLHVRSALSTPPGVLSETAKRYFRRSFRLRQVSAGGCNACEADCNVLSTPFWDMGRLGIEFVASPRHADGILVTGPVTENMLGALMRTWEAVPDPRVVIAVGSCAVSGGPYAGHGEVVNGLESVLPVDLFIPGCPPHPLSILDGLLRFLGRL